MFLYVCVYIDLYVLMLCSVLAVSRRTLFKVLHKMHEKLHMKHKTFKQVKDRHKLKVKSSFMAVCSSSVEYRSLLLKCSHPTHSGVEEYSSNSERDSHDDRSRTVCDLQ